jgi:hypothetical protein
MGRGSDRPRPHSEWPKPPAAGRVLRGGQDHQEPGEAGNGGRRPQRPHSACDAPTKAPSIVLIARQRRNKGKCPVGGRPVTSHRGEVHSSPHASLSAYSHQAGSATARSPNVDSGAAAPLPSPTANVPGIHKAMSVMPRQKTARENLTPNHGGIRRPPRQRPPSSSPLLPCPAPPAPMPGLDLAPKWLSEHHKEMQQRNTRRSEEAATVDWIIDKRHVHAYADCIAESAMRESLSVSEADPLCEPAPEIRPVWTGSGTPILGNGGGSRNSDFFFHRGFWKRSKGDIDGAIQVSVSPHRPQYTHVPRTV